MRLSLKWFQRALTSPTYWKLYKVGEGTASETLGPYMELMITWTRNFKCYVKFFHPLGEMSDSRKDCHLKAVCQDFWFPSSGCAVTVRAQKLLLPALENLFSTVPNQQSLWIFVTGKQKPHNGTKWASSEETELMNCFFLSTGCLTCNLQCGDKPLDRIGFLLDQLRMKHSLH